MVYRNLRWRHCRKCEMKINVTEFRQETDATLRQGSSETVRKTYLESIGMVKRNNKE